MKQFEVQIFFLAVCCFIGSVPVHAHLIAAGNVVDNQLIFSVDADNKKSAQIEWLRQVTLPPEAITQSIEIRINRAAFKSDYLFQGRRISRG